MTTRTWGRFAIGVFLTAAPVYGIVKAQYWDVPGWTGVQAEIYLFIAVLAASFGAAKAAMLEKTQDETKKQPVASTPEPSGSS